MTCPEFENKIKDTIKRFDMLAAGCTVTAGFSGGADSTALLYFLKKYEKEYGISVNAVHVNHCLRGEEADCDEKHARDFCLKYDIPFHSVKTDVRAIAEKQKISEELAGRNVRYEAFEKYSNGGLIATAHSLSDNIETVLFYFARGTSLHGMGGIPPVRGRIIRPLIMCTSAEIRQYCRDMSLPYVTDSTNSDNDMTRNLIRNEILPLFSEINPSFEKSAGGSIENLRIAGDYADKLACDLIKRAEIKDGYDAAVMKDADISVLSRAFSMLISEKFGISPQKKHIDALCSLCGNPFSYQISGKHYVKQRSGRIYFSEKTVPAAPFCTDPGVKKAAIPGGTVTTEIISRDTLDFYKKNNKDILDICVDYDKISNNYFFRSRKPSDVFTSAKRKNSKTLKKLLNEEAVPEELRNAVVILDSDGIPAFAEGNGPAQFACVTPSSCNIMVIRIERKDMCIFEK